METFFKIAKYRKKSLFSFKLRNERKINRYEKKFKATIAITNKKKTLRTKKRIRISPIISSFVKRLASPSFKSDYFSLFVFVLRVVSLVLFLVDNSTVRNSTVRNESFVYFNPTKQINFFLILTYI